jgi:hypothetical protein
MHLFAAVSLINITDAKRIVNPYFSKMRKILNLSGGGAISRCISGKLALQWDKQSKQGALYG